MDDTTRPGLRRDKQRLLRKGTQLRILVADEDPTRRRVMASLIVDKLAPAIAIEASDVPTALDVLLTRHPDFVFADLCLPGHDQGGFRLILDAASLGVPAVVTSGPIARSLELRLIELKIGWVPKGASESALFAVIDRAIDARRGARPEIASAPLITEPSRPRMHTA
jgi:CheY-like chemotaxis protein